MNSPYVSWLNDHISELEKEISTIHKDIFNLEVQYLLYRAHSENNIEVDQPITSEQLWEHKTIQSAKISFLRKKILAVRKFTERFVQDEQFRWDVLADMGHNV